jgi:L-idonate 5-dehydrogenase
MESLACILHGKKELNIESMPVADTLAPQQVLVRIGAGGICGSDLHYYLDGGFGTIRVKSPMALGHEVAGTVEAVGTAVTRVKAGDRIALNPSRPCNSCEFCLAGQQQHCNDMWFYGSAMRHPHSQGAFREKIIAEEFQCEPVGDHVSVGEAACAEPLAVALHAVNQAGALMGKKVLVAGAGPIGALVMAAARHAGATEIVAIDLHDAMLAKATEMGATKTINTGTQPTYLADHYSANKGYFDVVFECTGAPSMIRTILPIIRPRGTIVQIGTTGDVTFPVNVLVGKEIQLRGSQRFHLEYPLATALINSGAINVKPIITATVPFKNAIAAFDMAADRTTHMKVQLAFTD